MTAAVAAIRIRPGLYRIEGVTDQGKTSCGGQVYAEKVESHNREFAWECYCERCLDCDPNGWPSLRACVAEAAGFWMPEAFP